MQDYISLVQPKYLSREFLAQYANRPSPFPTDFGLLVFLRTYSRYLEEFQRRERWWEVVLRVVEYSMSLYKGPASPEALKTEAEELYDHIFHLKLFSAGRTLWAGGSEVVKQHGEANYNCSFKTIDSLEAFPEIFYLLMVGAGTGFSVERKYVNQLPELHAGFKTEHKPYAPVHKSMRIEYTEVSVSQDFSGLFAPIGTELVVLDKEYLVDETTTAVEDAIAKVDGKVKLVFKIGDSKEGWSGALKGFLHALTSNKVSSIVFNYNYVRPEGERLLTMGGRSSGPAPLQRLFEKTTWIIKKCGGKLSTLDAMDIANSIAEIVVVGGVRRSSQMTLGDVDDLPFVEAKLNLWTGANLDEDQVENLIAMLSEVSLTISRDKLRADLEKKRQENPYLQGIPFDLIFNQVTGGSHQVLWTGKYPAIEAFVDAHDPKYRYRANRVMSNNSVHLYENPGLDGLKVIFERIANNGEPGIYVAENAMKRRPNYAGTNPCKPMCRAS